MAVTRERVEAKHQDLALLPETADLPDRDKTPAVVPSGFLEVLRPRPLIERIQQEYPDDQDSAVAAAVYGLSEDVRTDLSTVSGSAQVLARKYGDDPFVQRLLAAASRMDEKLGRFSDAALAGDMQFERYYGDENKPYVPSVHSNAPAQIKRVASRGAVNFVLMSGGVNLGVVQTFLNRSNRP